MRMTGLIVAASVALFASGAQAMPVAPLTGGDAAVTLVRGGCGFGARRGAYGGCRLNRGPRGAIRRAITGAPAAARPASIAARGASAAAE